MLFLSLLVVYYPLSATVHVTSWAILPPRKYRFFSINTHQLLVVPVYTYQTGCTFILLIGYYPQSVPDVRHFYLPLSFFASFLLAFFLLLVCIALVADGDGMSVSLRSFERIPYFIHYCHMYRVGHWLFNKRYSKYPTTTESTGLCLSRLNVEL